MSKKSEEKAAAKGEAAAGTSNKVLDAIEKAFQEHGALVQRGGQLEAALNETRAAMFVAKGRAEGLLALGKDMGIDVEGFVKARNARLAAAQSAAPPPSPQAAPPADGDGGAFSDVAGQPPADDNVRRIKPEPEAEAGAS